MRVDRISISDFKGISSAEIQLSDFNAVFGENGSGKSSVLQALHWMIQSGSHPDVKPSREGKKSTLSERQAVYLPSIDYSNASNSGAYGNKEGSPELTVKIECSFNEEMDSDSSIITPVKALQEQSSNTGPEPAITEVATMTLKSARNAGLSAMPLS